MPKKVLVALPPGLLEQVDFIAECEHRTRSDLIREALRRYIANFTPPQVLDTYNGTGEKRRAKTK
jgi:metal-responsive CopG/Arc/MetJ family transcriptional regulator